MFLLGKYGATGKIPAGDYLWKGLGCDGGDNRLTMTIRWRDHFGDTSSSLEPPPIPPQPPVQISVSSVRVI